MGPYPFSRKAVLRGWWQWVSWLPRCYHPKILEGFVSVPLAQVSHECCVKNNRDSWYEVSQLHTSNLGVNIIASQVGFVFLSCDAKGWC